MKILAIETSCDESAAAVAEGAGDGVRILGSAVASQIDIHKQYGGVVPEVAAREHVSALLPVIHEALKASDAAIPRPSATPFQGGIDAIAVTTGPGLITSLMVGVETAKTLAFAWGMPVVAVHHVASHIYANFIIDSQLATRNSQLNSPEFRGFEVSQFPILSLTVSGGHTALILMKKHGVFETIGETIDDAAGEAFDKAAALMDLGYPGGPAVAAAAELESPPGEGWHVLMTGRVASPTIKQLPRPMIKSADYNFSFSGLKTALRYALEKDSDWKNKIPAYAAEYQQAIVDVLVAKTVRAAKAHGVKAVFLAGGVAANTLLRDTLSAAVAHELPSAVFHMPELQYTTDNAAMVAAAGYFLARDGKYTPWEDLRSDCNLKL